MRIGIGYDAHRLEKNRRLILGGVALESELGLLGHSDADVLIHAIMDALLGAAGMGDIGKHFPDYDDRYKDISSRELLFEVGNLIREEGFEVENIDSVIVAQKPRLSPYIEDMKQNIAKDLDIDISQISIKATTEESMGFTGREEGMSAHAVCLLRND